jgi:hypothetical protein
MVLLIVSILVLILGPVVRSVYPPGYSPESIVPPQNYENISSRQPVTLANPHSLCSQSVANWSLIQLAAIPILAEAQEIQTSKPEILKYLSFLTDVTLYESFSMESVISLDFEGKKLAVGLKPIPYTHEIGIYLENVLMEYYLQIAAIAPYFDLAYDNFLHTILRPISQSLLSGILGPNRLSVFYLDQARAMTNLEMNVMQNLLKVLRSSVEIPVVVGHGANGLLVKAIPFSSDAWRFSFEGPKLKDSPMATLSGADEESDVSRIVNFYSDESFTVSIDESALTNHRIPKYRSGISGSIPPNAFQTFCFVTAACGSDNRFDNLCGDVLGNETYLGIWNQLERPRIEEDTITLRERYDDLWEKYSALVNFY